MKRAFPQRALSLLLSLVLAVSLAAPVLADNGDTTTDPGTTTPGTGGTGTTTPPAEEAKLTIEGEEKITIDPGDGPDLEALVTPLSIDEKVEKITWRSDNEEIVKVEVAEGSKVGHLIGVAPGEATVTATAEGPGVPEGVTDKVDITVSGITIDTDRVEILENESVKLEEKVKIEYFGAVGEEKITNKDVTIKSDKPAVVRATGNRGSFTLDGITEGNATITITASAGGKQYTKSIYVTVVANTAKSIPATAGTSRPLRFSTLESQLAALCGEMIDEAGDTLSYLTGLSVPTGQGTLYLDYKSPDDTGSGVGSSRTYYVSSAARGPYIADITFVPNPYYTGEVATITYTGTAENGRTFKGEIRVTLDKAGTDLTINATYDTPAQLTGSMFSEVCQRTTGGPLSYVTFTLPPASSGVLYEDYVSESNYAAKVSPTKQYTQSQLDRLSFVPALGFVGSVTIGYTGYGVTGAQYNGVLTVNVTQDADGGPVYNAGGDGHITFDQTDFDDYSYAVTGERLDYVQFSLPAASQGTLYYGWESRGSRASLVQAGESYYYRGTPSLGDVTFVAADGFAGTVRIPFTARSVSGRQFTGTVELHFQTSSAGAIAYTCAPGAAARLSATDFEELCMDLTGRRLHYVTFQSLPDYAAGSLYHNRTTTGVAGTRVTRDAKYYSSAAPYLSNVSFWASDSFRGSVEIPFTGYAVSGDSFSGLLRISATDSGYTGRSVVSYSTDNRAPVTFDGQDFSQLCQTVTNAPLNYLQFSLPASGQGMLYYDYQTSGQHATPVSGGAGYYMSGDYAISRVTFLPAYGYVGVAYVPFTGYSTEGTQFSGTVEIQVSSSGVGTAVQYATSYAPVNFSAFDFQRVASGYQVSSVRFDALPAAAQGTLYYQYTSATQYSWLANPYTSYSLYSDPSLSGLTFVPKAGYTGTVTIPYTATDASGGTHTGQVVIQVGASAGSAYFFDMAGYDSQALAAVDYLYAAGVVNGMAAGQYGPRLPIRRGDFALMLYRAFKPASPAAGAGFSDVPYGAYYAQAVQTLQALGVVNGTGGGRYSPDATLTRQDAIVMVRRMVQHLGWESGDGSTAALSSYRDGSRVSDYAKAAMAWAAAEELLPLSDGALAPTAPLTRVDMAQVLHRILT